MYYIIFEIFDVEENRDLEIQVRGMHGSANYARYVPR